MGVRLRTTLAATVAVAVVLTGSAVLIVVGLDHRLVDGVRSATHLRAVDVASLVEARGRFDRLAADDVDQSLVQVLDHRGRVVASSSNIEGEPPIATMQAGEVRIVDHLSIQLGDDFVLVAEPATTADEVYLVLVARSLREVQHTTHVVGAVLAVAVPFLVLVVGLATWSVTGRALRPVEQMRLEVAAIGDEQLDHRIPPPGGRDEVARLASTLNEMLSRLEAARHRQQRFVSDASHELRSPLATTRHRLEAAIDAPRSVDVEALASQLLTEQARLEDLVDDLIRTARFDEQGTHAGGIAVEIDLDDIVMEECLRLRSVTSVRVDTSQVSAAKVWGDPSDLRRLVRNLLSNASRHARSEVTVALEVVDTMAVLVVDDDGPGIELEDRDTVFERFVRLDEARARDSGGVGLGPRDRPPHRDGSRRHHRGVRVPQRWCAVHGATPLVWIAPALRRSFCMDSLRAGTKPERGSRPRRRPDQTHTAKVRGEVRWQWKQRSPGSPGHPSAPASPSARGERRSAATRWVITSLLIVGPVVALAALVPLLWGRFVTATDLALATFFYVVTGHGITVGFHRMFTHHSFRPSRALKIALGVAGSMAIQGSITGWVANHRCHHVHSDQPDDPHSPHRFGSSPTGRVKGFLHAHVGWLYGADAAPATRFAPDLLRDRDVVVLSRLFPAFAVASLAIPPLVGWALSGTMHGALTAFLWAGLVRMALLHHVTWSINSVCHLTGRRPFRTADQSGNVAARRSRVSRGVVAQPASRLSRVGSPRRRSLGVRFQRPVDQDLRMPRMGDEGALARRRAATGPALLTGRRENGRLPEHPRRAGRRTLRSRR